MRNKSHCYFGYSFFYRTNIKCIFAVILHLYCVISVLSVLSPTDFLSFICFSVSIYKAIGKANLFYSTSVYVDCWH